MTHCVEPSEDADEGPPLGSGLLRSARHDDALREGDVSARSEATKQSTVAGRPLDCFAALATTDADRFAHIDTWVFDLDNTLYPASCDLWPKIDQRITLYMIRMFGLDGVSCRALQKHYYHRYGTTLRGLMTEHGIDADAFLAFVHDVDRSSLPPAPLLASAIAALPGRKLILTNGSRHHALETARRLGLDHVFEDVFDIIAAKFVAKPHEEAYERFFDRHAVEPTRAVLFEDLARNLVVPHRRGMTTVLVTPEQGGEDRREPWEIAHGREPHVDFSTSDLTAFLEGLQSR